MPQAGWVLPADLSAKPSKAYGSGYFGEWVTDEFGLPAYRYTCDQIRDPMARSPVHERWRGATDHTHQVGNDRLIAAVSNYGYVQVRQDEGSPKFLNDYFPDQGRYGAGIGFLTDGTAVLSTFYCGKAERFDRTLGQGYFRKTVRSHGYEVDQAIIAPFGDDPVLISQVKVTNQGSVRANLRWIEYWGCQNYQFSYRAGMQAAMGGGSDSSTQIRRQLAARFAHRFQVLSQGRGLIESQEFLGRTFQDEQSWEAVRAFLAANPGGFYGGPLPEPAAGTAMEDLAPPATFLISLDAPMDGFATHAANFFGSGSVANPAGLNGRLNNDLSCTGPDSALLLERRFDLQPGESRTLVFLYGYLPQGFAVDALIEKYQTNPSSIWSRSSDQWKSDGIRFRTPTDPWVERETSWHHYYLRSNLTYDSFFREHILSQGHVYQYLLGFQGAARDPLQHALPLVFSNPNVVREVIRYTLKEIQPDGSLPYAMVGCGVPMPTVFRPSDQELWLLWLASEYVLATRDRGFLQEAIPRYPRQTPDGHDPTIGHLLQRAFVRIVHDIGTGSHGLMRISNGDWNDEVVVGHVADDQSDAVRQHGESVLNAAMASYVLRYYGDMLRYLGDSAAADDAHAKAEQQRLAVQKQWAGSWFRRAWLDQKRGWLGDDQLWLEPQPWAIIGGAATSQQGKRLVAALNQWLRQPSPIGALIKNKHPKETNPSFGTAANGGIWPSINGTLTWALALHNGRLAWDEWKKNALAVHAEAYPHLWYGIWSGPDTYNSVYSQFPGQTLFADPASEAPNEQSDWNLNWTDFPVMNMHPHAWQLCSAVKLLGLEFDASGLRFQSTLPMAEYEFASPLLGFKKSASGYAGWYAPAERGTWDIELKLSTHERKTLRYLKINGTLKPLLGAARAIRFTGTGDARAPLRWELSHET